MKNLKTYILETDNIQEGFKLGKNKVRKTIEYKYFPKNTLELKKLIFKILKNDPNANLNDIDVSKIEDMSYLFTTMDNADELNPDISEWNVSNVKTMEMMFAGLSLFNCDLSNWDMSNVSSTKYMFYTCTNFDSNLSNWDVSKVEDMRWMFAGCDNFTGKGLENWDVSNVKSMYQMFIFCKSMKNKPSWYEN